MFMNFDHNQAQYYSPPITKCLNPYFFVIFRCFFPIFSKKWGNMHQNVLRFAAKHSAICTKTQGKVVLNAR